MTTKNRILIFAILSNLVIATIFLTLTFSQLADQAKLNLNESGRTFKESWVALNELYDKSITKWHPTEGETSRRAIWNEHIDTKLIFPDSSGQTVPNPLIEAMAGGTTAELRTAMKLFFDEYLNAGGLNFVLYISPENMIIHCLSDNTFLEDYELNDVCAADLNHQLSPAIGNTVINSDPSSSLQLMAKTGFWGARGSDGNSEESGRDVTVYGMSISPLRNGISLGSIVFGYEVTGPMEFFGSQFGAKHAIKFGDQIIAYNGYSAVNSNLELAEIAQISLELSSAVDKQRHALKTDGVFGYMDKSLSVSGFGLPINSINNGDKPFLILVKDQAEFLQNQRQTLLTSLGICLVFFLILLATAALTTSAFSGVGEAINVMRALARGDRSVSMPQRKQWFKSENDEIDLLDQALEAYKAHLDEMDEVKFQQQHQNRERDSIIMDKMGQLAAALDGEARQLILSDIAQMQQMAARVTSESSDDRSVELMTVAFSRMSNEVTALLEARTREMKLAYEQVAQINSEMRSSINYASVLQRAMLRAECFPDDFKIHLTWQPRDVVGGDIYVVRTTENKTVISVIDCTGHGVPGAFTSLIARAAFDRAFEDPTIVSAGDYLSESNRLIKNMLFQNEVEQAESDAGFDGTVCILDRVSGTLEFAGANASLFVIESGQVSELKGDKKSVGARRTPGGYKFTTQLVNAPKGMFVMLTDGVTDVMSQDQRPIAFGRKRLMRLMESIDASDPKVVVGEIMQAVDQYKGSGELRDDLTLLAFYIDQLQQFERAALPHDSVASGSLEG